MPFLIVGLIVLFVAVAMLRGFAGRDPAALTKLARYAGLGLLGALTLFFAATERWVPAVFLAGIGWSLYTEGRLLPRRDKRPDDPPPRERGSMTRDEALSVLGLGPDARDDDIRAAHRRLILQNHPDKGGSDYLASKVNQAKDVLLG